MDKDQLKLLDDSIKLGISNNLNLSLLNTKVDVMRRIIFENIDPSRSEEFEKEFKVALDRIMNANSELISDISSRVSGQ